MSEVTMDVTIEQFEWLRVGLVDVELYYDFIVAFLILFFSVRLK